MKIFQLSAACLAAWALCASLSFAQHNDIEFGYNNLNSPTAFMLEGGSFTLDGLAYWESDLFEFDPFEPGNFGSDEPGFTTNAAEGFLINTNDRIFLRVLNAAGNSAYGVGLVNYFNPNTGSLEASSSRRMLAQQNSGSFTDLIFNGVGIESGDNPVFLGAGNASGDLHDHILFDLLDDATAPLGAYGVLFQMEADFASNGFGQTDLSSNAFWIIWNHGMSHEDFETLALPAYGAGAIPEPGAFALLAISSVVISLRRRK